MIEKLNSTPIKTAAASLGGWPVVLGDKWDPYDNWTWQEAVLDYRRKGFGIDYIVDFSIGVDFKNSSKRVIDVSQHKLFLYKFPSINLFFIPFLQLDQSSTGLSREYMIKGLNETLVKAYHEYMIDLAVLFGANREKAEEELLQALQFEMKLSNVIFL